MRRGKYFRAVRVDDSIHRILKERCEACQNRNLGRCLRLGETKEEDPGQDSAYSEAINRMVSGQGGGRSGDNGN